MPSPPPRRRCMANGNIWHAGLAHAARPGPRALGQSLTSFAITAVLRRRGAGPAGQAQRPSGVSPPLSSSRSPAPLRLAGFVVLIDQSRGRLADARWLFGLLWPSAPIRSGASPWRMRTTFAKPGRVPAASPAACYSSSAPPAIIRAIAAGDEPLPAGWPLHRHRDVSTAPCGDVPAHAAFVRSSAATHPLPALSAEKRSPRAPVSLDPRLRPETTCRARRPTPSSPVGRHHGRAAGGDDRPEPQSSAPRQTEAPTTPAPPAESGLTRSPVCSLFCSCSVMLVVEPVNAAQPPR